jgi:Ca2+-binding RTX toxin-like protein
VLGGAGIDWLDFSASAVAVSVDLSLTTRQVTGEGEDRFREFENLRGSSKADTLKGNDLDNTLQGATGADTLTGGAGADRFVYTAVTDSRAANLDRITDFKVSDGDLVDVSAIDAMAGGGDDPFHFVSAFGGHAGEATLRYSSTTGLTTLSLDVDGDGAADFALTLAGAISASAAFVL